VADQINLHFFSIFQNNSDKINSDTIFYGSTTNLVDKNNLRGSKKSAGFT